MYTPINICVTPIISTSTNKIVMFYPLSVVAEMFIMCRFEPPPSIDNLAYMIIALLYIFSQPPSPPPHFWHFLDNIAPITDGISTDKLQVPAPYISYLIKENVTKKGVNVTKYQHFKINNLFFSSYLLHIFTRLYSSDLLMTRFCWT